MYEHQLIKRSNRQQTTVLRPTRDYVAFFCEYLNTPQK